MESKARQVKWLSVGEFMTLPEGKRHTVDAWVKRQYKQAARLGICLERVGVYALKRVETPDYGCVPDRVMRCSIGRGMSMEDAAAMFNKCAGTCHICRMRKALVVDHCHATGKVRGYLCNGCNVGLGQLGDRADLLMRAVRYLEEAEESAVPRLEH